MATTSAPPTLDPKDVLGLDHLLGDEERHAARLRPPLGRRPRAARDRPTGSRRGSSRASSPRRSATSACSACTSRATAAPARAPTAYGVACRELEDGDSGHPQPRLRAGLAGDVPDLEVRLRGAEAAVAAAAWRPATLIGCFGLTEPDFGSDPSGMRTTRQARRRRLGPQRHQACGSPTAASPTWRSCGRATTTGIRGFVVPTDTKGFSASNIHHKLSLRASVTSELSLDDVRLPADAVLPEVKSMRGPLSCLNEARYGICWGAVGAGRALLRVGARVRQDARAVRPADRRLPAHPAQARRHDARAPEGAAAWRGGSGS